MQSRIPISPHTIDPETHQLALPLGASRRMVHDGRAKRRKRARRTPDLLERALRPPHPVLPHRQRHRVDTISPSAALPCLCGRERREQYKQRSEDAIEHRWHRAARPGRSGVYDSVGMPSLSVATSCSLLTCPRACLPSARLALLLSSPTAAYRAFSLARALPTGGPRQVLGVAVPHHCRLTLTYSPTRASTGNSVFGLASSLETGRTAHHTALAGWLAS